MNPLLGILFHAIGGFAAGSFYIPYNQVKNWAWEVYWLVGGFFAWILAPWIISFIFVPDLTIFLSSISFSEWIWSYLFGALWGIGAVTFGLTMRYLGMSLGMAMALGLTATFGTLVPPIYFQQFGQLLSTASGLITLGGVLICLIGIALTGKAGMMKDKELSDTEKTAQIKEFNLKKGILVAVYAGIMSACFAFALSVGKPIADKAILAGSPELFSNSPIFIFAMGGGFTTNLIWCMTLAIRNKKLKDYFKLKDTPILSNYIFSALAGFTWYCQFMFYGMGSTQMGEYDFSSWSIHTAFIIFFSNIWGLILKEWKGSSNKTIRMILLGLGVLIISTIIIGVGNYVQQFETQM